MAIFNLTYDAVKDLYTGTVGSYNGGGPCYVTVLFNSGSPIPDGLRLFNSEADYPSNYFASSSTQQIDGTNTWTGTITSGLISPSTMTWTITSAGEPEPTTFNDNIAVPSSDIDTKMGDAYYEENLTTNVKKYFAEALKLDGSQFVMDGNRVVALKQSFIDTLAVDLTNIVNTSITTATLTADNATINETLTALGVDVTGLLTAAGVEVGTDGLVLKDEDGVKHSIHLGN